MPNDNQADQTESNNRIGSDLSRRKILAGVGGGVGAGALLGGGVTWAFLQDQETFPNNQMVDGELNLKVTWQQTYNGDPVNAFPDEDGDGVQDEIRSRQEIANDEELPIDSPSVETAFRNQFADVPDDLEAPIIELDDVKPTDQGQVKFGLHIFGNPGLMELDGELLDNSENDLTEPEEDAGDTSEDTGELADAIQTQLWLDSGEGIPSPENIIFEGDLKSTLEFLSHSPTLFANRESSYCTCFPSSTTHQVVLNWNLPETVQSETQTDSADFSLQFQSEQCRGNKEPDFNCTFTSKIESVIQYPFDYIYRRKYRIKVVANRQWNDAEFWIPHTADVVKHTGLCTNGDAPESYGEHTGVMFWKTDEKANDTVTATTNGGTKTITATKITFEPGKGAGGDWMYDPCEKGTFDICTTYFETKAQVPPAGGTEGCIVCDVTRGGKSIKANTPHASVVTEVATSIKRSPGYHTPENLIDDDVESVATIVRNDNEIIIDLGIPQWANHIGLLPDRSTPISHPATIEVWVGSNDDGQTFDQQVGVLDFPPSNDTVVRSAFDQFVHKRHYKLKVKDRWSDSNTKTDPAGASLSGLRIEEPIQSVPEPLPVPQSAVELDDR